MKIHVRASLVGLLASLVCVIAPGVAWAQATYRLTDLGTLGGSFTYGAAINASGQATGHSSVTGDVTIHAFIWDGLAMRDLGTLGGSFSDASAINAKGDVVGHSATMGNEAFHAFVFDGAVMRDLGTLGGQFSQSRDINDAGTVVGAADHTFICAVPIAFLWAGRGVVNLDPGGLHSGAVDINSSGQATGFQRIGNFDADTCTNGYPTYDHAVIWDGKDTKDLGTLGGPDSRAYAINEFGQVVGQSNLADGTARKIGETYHAFLWDGVSMRDLGTLGGARSVAWKINDSGHVAGYSLTTGDAEWHAFFWDGAQMRDLGTLGLEQSYPSAISDADHVIGAAGTPNGSVSRAFLWDGTATYALDELIDPADPLQPYVALTGASDLNERGQILAQGMDSRTGHAHAYLLSPKIAPYAFSGFFSPVDNPPTRNVSQAGSAIPVKFSLNGYQGMEIFATGYPISRRIQCTNSYPLDDIEETVTAGSSELSYSVGADQYQYIWKTDASWAGTCRQLVVRFFDQTEHVADFRFR